MGNSQSKDGGTCCFILKGFIACDKIDPNTNIINKMEETTLDLLQLENE